MSERVFDKKLRNAGFRDIEIFDHRTYGIDDLAPYPLFPETLLNVLRDILPPEKAGNVATAVIVRARKPGG